MSSLEKLSIQGIRCFGPNESEMGIIQFGRPLTLIVGDNGCGKTTIIEALNYATCGKLPPGCQGASSANFVHDPKLIDRADVKGQVRLQFKDVKGQTVAVSRLVQVTDGAIKAQFKSLDQTVSRMGENGQWDILPSRCADADTEVCEALGVSKSVLSNVLLCHQEDSNWPLGEDSKVKAKFDEIFGSDRYNKCLIDELKKTRLKLNDDESKLKLQLEHLSNYKEQASTLKIRHSDQELRFETLQKDVNEYQAKMEPIQKRLKELSVAEDEVSQFRASLETYKAQLKGSKTKMKTLRSLIQQEFKGSPEELSATLRNFEKELKDKENSLERLQIQDAEMKEKLDSIERSLSKEQIRLSQLNGDLEANKKRMESRGKAILSLSEELGFNIAVSQVSQADEVLKVITELEGSVMQKNKEIEVVIDKQKETAFLREKRAKIERTISSKEDGRRTNNDELKKVTRIIDQSAASCKIQTKLDQNKKEYDELSKTEDVDLLKSKISSAKGESDRLEEDLMKLEKQVTDLQLLSQVQAELDVQRNSKAANDAEFKKLKDQLEARMNQYADTIKTKNEQWRKMEKDIATKEAKHEHLSQRLMEAKEQLVADDFAVQQACGGQDYDVYVAELSEKLERLREETCRLSTSYFFYQKLQENKSCPVCKRGFDSDDSVCNRVSRLNLKMREVSAKLVENKEQLDQTQDKYEKLLQLKSKHEKVAYLKNNEIPALESNLERKNQGLTRLKKLRSEILVELSPHTSKSMAESIQSDMSQLEQYHSESLRLAEEVAKREDELRVNSGPTKTLQEAIDEQREAGNMVQQNRKTIEDLENRLRNFKQKRRELRREKRTLKDEQLKISGNSKRREQLIERKKELELVESRFQIELNQLNGELTVFSGRIEQNERESQAHESNKYEINEMMKTFSDVYSRIEDIKKLNSDIVEYELSGGPKKFEMCKQKIEKMHKTRDELNRERDMINNRCEDIKKDILTHESRKRDLKANVQLREVMEEKKKYIGKVEELNKKIGDMNLASIFDERNTLQNEETRLYSCIKEAEGSLGELKKSIRSIKTDLEQPHLKKAEAEYREKLVHAEVIDKAKKDLENFNKALDWSLMSYHQEKIKHINTAIAELWRKVYSGNDIDGIRILAEQEPGASPTKRRAFKYRVIQTKCGVDLDMRNRCSAGQKVLACLIIRIALAETFSSHCGILALDEPTTNLDQEHIKHLSQTLIRLVQHQAGRKNFQLVVISHDKEFLDELTGCGLEHYYKLERNSEGKSRIVKMTID